MVILIIIRGNFKVDLSLDINFRVLALCVCVHACGGEAVDQHWEYSGLDEGVNGRVPITRQQLAGSLKKSYRYYC